MVKYKYKIRVRSDEAILQPLPDITNLIFIATNQHNQCLTGQRIVYYPNLQTYGETVVEDKLCIGEADAMDHVLDRYVDLTEKVSLSDRNWTSDSHMRRMLNERYNICLLEHPNIFATTMIRKDDDADIKPVRLQVDWVEVKPYTVEAPPAHIYRLIHDEVDQSIQRL
jgi:hypothetical protein